MPHLDGSAAVPKITRFVSRIVVCAVGGVMLAAAAPATAQVVLHEISGMAWRDRVPDGVRAAHEAALGVPDHPIELRDGVTNAVLRTTTTDADGRYRFTVGSMQPARSYRIVTTAPSTKFLGFSPRRVGNDPAVDSDIHPSGANAGQSDAVIVTLAAPATNLDIGLVMRSIAIGDLAWFDRSPNGLQSVFEPGLQGLVVEAWNPERTVRFDQAVTDVQGKYRFQVPGWGPYRLRFEALTGTSFTQRQVGDDPTMDSDVIATGVNTGWTGVIQIGYAIISTQNVDAGYLVADGGFDVALDYAEPGSVVFPGFGAAWSLRVREGLGLSVSAVRVQAPVPPGIQGMSWTCQGTGGASCPSGGINALDFTVAMPPNSTMTIAFAGQVTQGAASIIAATAETMVNAPQWDAFPQNSTAQLSLRNDRLFGNGFQ